MILKETILSAFTEKATLLQWLKKVEKLLNENILTEVNVEQINETQIKLVFIFENGDHIESPVITLPRGEKGEDGKDGLNGEGIAATIEVGTVTTGEAGTDASVTNVGTEQRAILNFVIPRGANGEEGSAGVGFDDASSIEQNSGTNALTADNNGLTIGATFKMTAGNEVFEIPSSMFLAVKGSESIVIDVDESGTFFDIHLDADITAKLQRVLVTPATAPASISLVAIDTNNAQTMLSLGDGLSVSDGVISASGGGGGGGGASVGKSIEIANGSYTGAEILYTDGTTETFTSGQIIRENVSCIYIVLSSASRIYASEGVIINTESNEILSTVGFDYYDTPSLPTSTKLCIIPLVSSYGWGVGGGND